MSDAFTPGEDARLVAALDQLRATLSEITGHAIVEPVIVVARERERNGLLVFNAGLEFAFVPDVLREVADWVETREADVERGRDE